MKSSVWICSLAILFLQACSFTQKVKTGTQAYEVKQYAVALELFKQEYPAAQTNTEKAQLAYTAGKTCVRLNQQADAAEWFNKAYKDGYGEEARYQYAQVLTRQEKYDEAIVVYDDMAASSPNQAIYRAAATVCRQAKDWKKNPDKTISVEQAKFNSPAADYAPQPIGPGQVLFSSDRDTKHTGDTYLWTGRAFSDLLVYYAGDQTIQEFDSRINTADNEGAAIISPNGQLLVFTRCYVDQSYDGWCRLMYSLNRGNAWSTPSPFPFMREKTNYGQPAFAANGTTLFFSSDAEGGQGGHDLYFSQWNGGSNWTDPVNLGPVVNTSGDEEYPTVYKDTLYFSSDHLPGLGGLDIFKTWLDKNNNWAPPINLKAPVNSGGDDFGFVADTFAQNEDGILRTGYFTTSRGGPDRNDDIYSFTIKRTGPDKPVVQDTTPVVIDEPVVDYKIFVSFRVMEPIFEDKEDPNSRRTGSHILANGPIIITDGPMDQRMTTDELGQLLLALEWNKKYLFTARYRDHLAATFELNTAEITKDPEHPISTINHTFMLDPIFKNKEIILENIFYDYDKWDIREDAQPSLNHLSAVLKTNPGIKIQLTSHTDCRGTDEYNQELSQKRAQSAIEYLISTGIPATRLIAVGMGESAPAVQCECEQCTEAQHQANRRTTFKIID